MVNKKLQQSELAHMQTKNNTDFSQAAFIIKWKFKLWRWLFFFCCCKLGIFKNTCWWHITWPEISKCLKNVMSISATMWKSLRVLLYLFLIQYNKILYYDKLRGIYRGKKIFSAFQHNHFIQKKNYGFTFTADILQY